jgi:hypothetical protein
MRGDCREAVVGAMAMTFVTATMKVVAETATVALLKAAVTLVNLVVSLPNLVMSPVVFAEFVGGFAKHGGVC